jgi:methyl-accepting chemotaxis protein
MAPASATGSPDASPSPTNEDAEEVRKFLAMIQEAQDHSDNLGANLRGAVRTMEDVAARIAELTRRVREAEEILRDLTNQFEHPTSGKELPN